MLVQIVSGKCYTLTHGKGRQHGADAQAVYMTDEQKCQSRRNSQAGNIKGNFYFGIGNLNDFCQLTRKQIRRNNRQTATIGKSNTNTDKHIAYDKIQYTPGKILRQYIDIQLEQIKKLAENKAYNKAEQIGRHKFLSQLHQTCNQQALENIGPCSERQMRKGFGKGKGHAADSTYAGA
mgnify:CR=1 FL=1